MNLMDFPEAASAPYGVEILHPDEFLTVLCGLDPQLAVDIVTEQAGALQKPPLTVHGLLDRLSLTVPTFAAAIRSHLPERTIRSWTTVYTRSTVALGGQLRSARHA
jgi:hypothetical protein